MELPKPGPEHKALERIAGDWVGEETIHPGPFDPVGGKATARVKNGMAVGGFALVQDYEQQRGDGVNFIGHGVLRWDAPAGEYSMQWIDSSGFPPSEFRGTIAGDVMTLASRSPMGHARAIWKFAADHYDYRMELSQDGSTWHPFLDGTYRRKA